MRCLTCTVKILFHSFIIIIYGYIFYRAWLVVVVVNTPVKLS